MTLRLIIRSTYPIPYPSRISESPTSPLLNFYCISGKLFNNSGGFFCAIESVDYRKQAFLDAVLNTVSQSLKPLSQA